MKNVLILIAALILFHSSLLTSDQYKHVKVFIADGQAFRKLLSSGIDFEGASGKIGGWVEVTVSSEELDRIQTLGFQTQVTIEDLTKYFSRRLTKVPYNALGFGDGSMGGNYTFDEVVQQLDSMRTSYPELISEKFSIGNTLQGRDIWAVRLTKNPDISTSKPEVLYTGLTHAREPQGMMNLIYFMWHLLQNYGSDPEATYLVDNRQLYFVPVINADGYEANRRISPTGGGMRRKNMRNVVSDNDYDGVDLNRNYGYMWGFDNVGSSPYTDYETYRGTGPFSEPETQTIALFCQLHNFRLALNYHSYGMDLLYAWDYTTLFESPDSVQYAEYGKDMTKFNKYIYGASGKNLYLVNGGATDWMYGDQDTKNKILAMLPEVGSSSDGFWPSSSRILPIAQENLYPNLYLANVAGSYPRLFQYTIEDSSGDGFLENGEPFTVHLSIRNKGLDTTQNLSLDVSTSGTAIRTPVHTYSIPSLASLTNYEISLPCSVGSHTPVGYQYLYATITENPSRFMYDTIKVFIGKLHLTFSDSAEHGMTNWDAGVNWGLSTLAHSPLNSFTDSPEGNYTDLVDNSMTMISPITLNHVEKAYLKFWCRWDIESGYDFVTVEASSNGGANWQTLNGAYTRLGSGIGVQTAGTYGYDGTHKEWIEEEMDVSQYVSSNFKIRFRLRSDEYVNYDGFYVDDIRLLVNYKDTTQRTVILTLNDRWNLVSVPIDTESVVKENIFPTSISSAYAYSGSSYVPFDTLRKTVGYWLKVNASTEVQWEGASNLNAIIGVSAGWNLIGSISEPIVVSSITSDPPSILTGNIFGYNGSYFITDTIYPGFGYWIKASQEGSLILSTMYMNSLAKNRIKIVASSEMPPPPPAEDAFTTDVIPRDYALDQAYPSPFNPTTTINYQMPEDSKVVLRIYNVLGKLEATLVDENQPAGFQSATWTASSTASGIYFYRLDAVSVADPGKSFTQVKKMILLK
jgi:carboxypeptidase T